MSHYLDTAGREYSTLKTGILRAITAMARNRVQ